MSMVFLRSVLLAYGFEKAAKGMTAHDTQGLRRIQHDDRPVG